MSKENQEPEGKDKGENALPAWTRVTKGPLPYFATNSELYPEIAAASTHDAGVAWKLMTYCAQMRNGGFIEGCQDWSDARWNKLFSFSKKPKEKSVFYRWENNGLRVLCYDAEKDAQALETSRKRKAAAYERWRRHNPKKADANADANADAKKRREEKRREDEEDFSSKKSSSSSSHINRIPSSSDAWPSVGATGPGTDDGAPATSTAQQPPPPSAPPPPSEGEIMTDKELTAGFNEIRKELEDKMPATPTPTHAPAPQPEAAEDDGNRILTDEELRAGYAEIMKEMER